MIQFRDLRITSDDTILIIDTSVIRASYFDNITIDSITVDNQDTYSPNGPSDHPVYEYKVQGDVRDVSLKLDYKQVTGGLKGNIFIVYVKVKGTPGPDIPCDLDKITSIGVALNIFPIYNSNMMYIKEVESTCKIPKNFIDQILRYKALDLSIRTGHYSQAIKYWNKFFKGKLDTINPITCGCYD